MSQFNAEKYEAKITAIQASAVINAARTCASVASTSDAGVFYLVEIDATTRYSTHCACPAYGDCCHRDAIDRMLSSQRPGFYATLQAASVEAVDVMTDEQKVALQGFLEEAAASEAKDAYDVLAETKRAASQRYSEYQAYMASISGLSEYGA